MFFPRWIPSWIMYYYYIEIMNQQDELNPLLKNQLPTDPEHLAKQRATPQQQLHVGREMVKLSNFMEASKCFAKSIMAFQFLVRNQLMTQDETVDMFRSIVIPAQSNLALCYMKLGSYDTLVNLCNEILGHNPKNVKALYRRGIGKYYIKQFDEAIEDFQSAIQLDKEIAQDCKSWIASCQRDKARQKEKMKKMASNFIDSYGENRKSQPDRNPSELIKQLKKMEQESESWIARLFPCLKKFCPRLFGPSIIIKQK